MENNLNYNSIRSVEARLNAKLGKPVAIISLVLTILLLVFGGMLLLSGRAIGWLVVSLGIWLLTPYLWIKLHLCNLAPSKTPHAADDLLAGDLLGLIPAHPTPHNLIPILASLNGGRFFTVRFGLSADAIAAVTPDEPSLMSDVWAESYSIWEHLSPNERTNTISAAIVMAAIIRLNPNTDNLLHEQRIDKTDISKGAAWFEHINWIIQNKLGTRLTGGIARDWSFGYIPTLEHFGTNLSSKYTSGDRSMNTDLESNRQIVGQMISMIGGNGRRNVALIGPFGAGKSTVVDTFAETIMDSKTSIPSNIRYNQVFKLDASAIVSAASGRGQIEQLVNQLMVEAFKAKNIILFLDNAELFFEDGTGAVDLSNLLQPVIEGGALKLIMAMDEQKFLQIAQTKPALATSLNRIEVQPSNADETLKILEDRIIPLEYANKCVFTYQSLTEAYRLSGRYVSEVAQPRNAVQLLENSVQQMDASRMITAMSISATIEKTLGIKVGGDLAFGDNQAERERLLNLENLIHERMINQKNAVAAVAGALRRARAGVRNENRPIGTFLFLGPTGVGKTELAKSLASVYFGGEGKMVRIDMNEYVRSEDVARLIADGATDPNSLSAQVRKNPFSVVLLDEIEKAHPNVLTTLLQVLDEGILRDINNREVSFRDAIVIATSNAGAERIRQYIEAGYQIEQFSQQIQDELISSGQFKPEFLNRFDEIAVFRPLTKDELLQVVDLILQGVNKSLANQKVFVNVDEDAKRALVDAGYDPRLGARPMRRVVQRTVENIVAEKMLSGELVAGSGIDLTLADIQRSLAQSM